MYVYIYILFLYLFSFVYLFLYKEEDLRGGLHAPELSSLMLGQAESDGLS